MRADLFFEDKYEDLAVTQRAALLRHKLELFDENDIALEIRAINVSAYDGYHHLIQDILIKVITNHTNSKVHLAVAEKASELNWNHNLYKILYKKNKNSAIRLLCWRYISSFDGNTFFIGRLASECIKPLKREEYQRLTSDSHKKLVEMMKTDFDSSLSLLRNNNIDHELAHSIIEIIQDHFPPDYANNSESNKWEYYLIALLLNKSQSLIRQAYFSAVEKLCSLLFKLPSSSNIAEIFNNLLFLPASKKGGKTRDFILSDVDDKFLYEKWKDQNKEINSSEEINRSNVEFFKITAYLSEHGRFQNPNNNKSFLKDIDSKLYHNDFAVRIGAYRSCKSLSPKQFDEFYEKDGDEFLLALIEGMNPIIFDKEIYPKIDGRLPRSLSRDITYEEEYSDYLAIDEYSTKEIQRTKCGKIIDEWFEYHNLKYRVDNNLEIENLDYDCDDFIPYRVEYDPYSNRATLPIEYSKYHSLYQDDNEILRSLIPVQERLIINQIWHAIKTAIRQEIRKITIKIVPILLSISLIYWLFHFL